MAFNTKRHFDSDRPSGWTKKKDFKPVELDGLRVGHSTSAPKLKHANLATFFVNLMLAKEAGLFAVNLHSDDFFKMKLHKIAHLVIPFHKKLQELQEETGKKVIKWKIDEEKIRKNGNFFGVLEQLYPNLKENKKVRVGVGNKWFYLTLDKVGETEEVE